MLTFTLFRFPIQLHWSFAIVFLFVLDSELPLVAMLLWAVTVFVSILIHELGHAFTARHYGGDVDSVLIYAMGGLTRWRRRHGRAGHRFLISAAGSGVQILFGLAVFGIAKQGLLGDAAELSMRTPVQVTFWWAGFREYYVAYIAGAFVWVSVFWGLLNWVPIAGLDGSHMLREFMVKINPETGVLHSKIIGLIFSVLVGVILYQNGFRFAPFIFIWFGIQDLMDRRIVV